MDGENAKCKDCTHYWIDCYDQLHEEKIVYL